MAKGNKNAFLEVPYHVGCLTMDEDDERRHRARCRYFKEENSCEHYSRCIGSSHCTYYKEKESKDLENNIKKKRQIKSNFGNKTSKESKEKAEENLYNITAGRMINKYKKDKEKSKLTQITLEEIKIKNSIEIAQNNKKASQIEMQEVEEKFNKQLDFKYYENRRKIKPGDLVEVLYLENNEKDIYEIVKDSEEDVLNNKIKSSSPMGKKLIGKEIGDRFIVNTFKELEIEIIDFIK